MEKVKFIMMVGIPGSGKSYVSELIKQKLNNSIIISSDELRIKLFNNVNDIEHDKEVFEEMKWLTIDSLKKGINVIYDATNCSSKRRIAFLENIKKYNCKKCCVYMATPFEDCINNNNNRDRKVGYSVIKRMYKGLQIPTYEEGFDDIKIIGNQSKEYEFNIDDIKTYEDYVSKVLNNEILNKCIDCPQDNPHHIFSVSRHMYYSYKSLKENRSKYMKLAMMLHDVGKPFCKTFKKLNSDQLDKYAHYYNHANVSAQLATLFLMKCNICDSEIINTVKYITYHMNIYDIIDSEKGKNKFISKFGNKFYQDLIDIYNSDNSGK